MWPAELGGWTVLSNKLADEVISMRSFGGGSDSRGAKPRLLGDLVCNLRALEALTFFGGLVGADPACALMPLTYDDGHRPEAGIHCCRAIRLEESEKGGLQ